MKHSRHTRSVLGSLALSLVALGSTQTLAARASVAAVGLGVAAPEEPMAAPPSATPSSIVDLQPFRQVSSMNIESEKGLRGTATLVNLNPTVNAWYLLRVLWQDSSQASYHLENPQPRSQTLAFDPKYPAGVELLQGSGRQSCKLFGDGANGPLAEAGKSHVPYAPLCDGRLFLRNPVKGHLTRLEAEAEFVRTQVWGGEKITVIFHHLLEDTHRQTGELRAAADQGGAMAPATEDNPLPALVDPKYTDRVLTPSGLGLALENAPGAVRPGAWYAARDNPGVYVSLIEPQLIDAPIIESHKGQIWVTAGTPKGSIFQFELPTRGTSH